MAEMKFVIKFFNFNFNIFRNKAFLQYFRLVLAKILRNYNVHAYKNLDFEIIEGYPCRKLKKNINVIFSKR